jgi:hypothetical protein
MTNPSTPHPVVQFVVDDEGIAGAYVDDPKAATKHARKVSGVVVAIAAQEDHRDQADRTPDSSKGL